MNINWGRVVPWLLVVILALILFIDLKGCNKPVIKDGPELDSVTYWRTKSGELVASLKATEDELAQAPKKYRDSIADLLHTKDALLKEVVDLKMHGTTTIYSDTGHKIQTVYVGDSGHKQLESVSQVFSNPYYQVVANLNIIHDALSTVQIQTWDSLLLAWHVVKSGNIFTRKQYLELDIKNSNPYSTVTNAQAYRVPEISQKKYALYLGIGWGYGFNAGSGGSVYGYPVISLSVGRALIHF